MSFWLNGEFFPSAANAPGISVTDESFLLGRGVFETILVKDGRPQFLDRHLQRMLTGAKIADFEIVHYEEMGTGLVELLSRASKGTHRLRITASPESTLMTLTEFQGYTGAIDLGIAPWRLSQSRPLQMSKSTSYGDYWYARKWATEMGFDDALLLNSQDEIMEVSTANIFFLNKGEWVTPHENSGVFPGVIRSILLEMNFAKQVDLASAALSGFSACFVTSSLRLIQPVKRIDGLSIDNSPFMKDFQSLRQELESIAYA